MSICGGLDEIKHVLYWVVRLVPIMVRLLAGSPLQGKIMENCYKQIPCWEISWILNIVSKY